MRRAELELRATSANPVPGLTDRGRRGKTSEHSCFQTSMSVPTNLRRGVALLGILSITTAIQAAPATDRTIDTVTPPARPTEVAVGVYVVDVVKIDGAEQLFTADLSARFVWHDPRLANATGGPRTLPLDDVWHPHLAIANLRDVKNTLPEVVEVAPDGTVLYRQRMVGDFSSRLDLHAFPQDRQTLPVHLVARGFTPEELRFVPTPKFTGRAEDLTIIDWSVGPVTLREHPYQIPQLGVELPGIIAELQTKRRVAYYFGTVFASATIIVCMAWLVFWISLDAINPRISVSVTSMLTLIAHRFVIQGELPRLPYLTRMDYFLLGSTFMVLLALVGVVAVFKVLNDGNRAKAERLNLIFRWGFPLAFIVLLVAVL